MSEPVPGPRARPTRSALFVDFDNIYSGLHALDPAAAEAFATDPLRWVGWLARGEDSGGPPRRFLVQVCYLNPNVYSRYRAFFMRTGFRVVDCPPLTSQGKTSADIHIVLDVLDALAHETRYDDFVIASADADFTPLLYRLRASDRRTAVVTAGPASAAYRAVSDSVILADQFADAVLTAAPSPGSAQQAIGMTNQTGPAPLDAQAEEGRLAAVRAVRGAVAAAREPLLGATAAQAALVACPSIKAERWAGAGSFSAWIDRDVPDLHWARTPPPGYVYDRSRHSEADLPTPREPKAAPLLAPVVEQVARVTGTPLLSSEHYAILFEELADELRDKPFVRSETTRFVRDRAVVRGAAVSRPAVNNVVTGLVYSGHGLALGSTPRALALAFAENVRTLCRTAQMELSVSQVRAVDVWLAGGLR